jgi:hypothetical protein
MDHYRDHVELECESELTSGEPSIQTRATTPLDEDTFPTRESESEPKHDVAENQEETESFTVKPLPRTYSRTFPQAYREMKELDFEFLSSIDAQLGKSGQAGKAIEAETAARNASTRSRRLQPVPEDFQAIDDSKRKLLEDCVFKMKAVKLEIRPEQAREQAQIIQNSKHFVKIWESRLLPELEKVLDDNVKEEYTVNVTRGSEPGQRTIVIMTVTSMSENVKGQLQKSKSTILPGDLDSATTVMFREGRVEFLTDPGSSMPLSRASTESSDDPCTSPLNTGWHRNPSIGDSVGWTTESATLGPMLQIDGKFYRLLCWHLFDDNGRNQKCSDPRPPEGLSTHHPSDSDCNPRDPNAKTYIGDVCAYSGLMYRTSRSSVSIGQDSQTRVVTDWALIDSAEAGSNRLNRVRRKMPDSDHRQSEVDVTQVQDPKSFLRGCENNLQPPHVYSVGRTSGYTTGQLSEIPAFCRLSGDVKTRNWAVENVESHNDKAVKEWISSGMGIPGDSGAGVFSLNGNELLGQIWGRNAYKKSNLNPRITYFTSMSDIYADIGEKMPGSVSIQLPTCQPIIASPRHEDDPVISDIIRQNHPPREKWNEAYLNVDDQDHRSAATSRRLGPLAAVRKNATFINQPGCQPFQRWAKAIIHAATF